jgi:multidrug efflux pump subunit AcrA (membrane-fusion protein)
MIVNQHKSLRISGRRPIHGSLRFTIAWLAIIAWNCSDAQSAEPAGTLVLERCIVSVKDEANIPAKEPGVLINLHVREGMRVSEGMALAQIDDEERVVQKEIAEFERDSAAEEAKSDINIRYSQAATDVAEAEYQAAIEANKKVAGTVPFTEVRKLKLAWHKSSLEITQSELEQRVAKLTAQAKSGEVKLADTSIHHRRIASPINGEVVECYKHVGEWVELGDQVLRVVRFDKLRVEGFVKADAYHPRSLLHRRVTVSVSLAQGEKAEFAGEVVYVHPFIESGNVYRIWVDVTNRLEEDHWLLRPGQSATMTIYLQDRVPSAKAASEERADTAIATPAVLPTAKE